MNYKLRIKLKLLTSYILSHKSKFGFSLIELLIVIGVIGVLTSSLVVIINPVAQLQKARDAQRKSDLKQIQSALEMYRADIGSYPATLKNCNSNTALGNSLATPSCTSIYMSKVPNDPRGGNYTYTLSGASYTLVGCLENLTDTQADSPFVNCTVGGSAGHTITVVNP